MNNNNNNNNKRTRSNSESEEHTIIEERIAIFVAINAVIQFIGDIIVESLHLVPTRINHLSLTLLNAFLAFKTLSAIHKQKFRFLHEDIQILFLLEVLLILGDVFYIIDDGWDQKFVLTRLTFVLFSCFNMGFASYIMYMYELYHLTFQGDTCREFHGTVDNVNDVNDVNV